MPITNALSSGNLTVKRNRAVRTKLATGEMKMGLRKWLAGNVAGPEGYGNFMGRQATEGGSALANAVFLTTEVGRELGRQGFSMRHLKWKGQGSALDMKSFRSWT